MQFYLDGYRPGDPEIAVAELPNTVDVLIVGSGPAGPCWRRNCRLSQASAPDSSSVARAAGGRSGRRRRLSHGRNVRGLRSEREAHSRGLLGERDCLLASVESRSLADRAYRSRPGRRGRAVGVPARHRQPGSHAGVPARLHAQVADATRARLRSGIRRASRSKSTASTRSWSRCATLETAPETTVRAKYVVGCDGARSPVRESIGAESHGDFANHAWGVDGHARRHRLPGHPPQGRDPVGDDGNILLIPREGGYLVRLYVDLGEIDPDNRDAVR